MSSSEKIKIYEYMDKELYDRRNKILNKIFNREEVSDKELSFFDLNFYSPNYEKTNLLKYLFNSKLDKNIYLNQYQIEILNIMHKNNIFLSAPTSFGKTFLAMEYIKLNEDELNNVVFIVPTLALMNELLKKIYKFFSSKFNICINSFENFESKNIFIFVPERSDINFLKKIENSKIDLLIFDEIYKLGTSQNKDERLMLMNKIYFNLVKKSNKIFLLGPFIKEVSFSRTKLDIVKYYTNFSAICSEYEDISNKNWINSINFTDKNLVYFEKPENIYKLSQNVMNIPICNSITNKFKDEIEFLEKKFHKKWFVIDFLKRGIGIHHGKIPMFLRKFFENEYSKSSLNILFCTSTLMEGINTPSNRLIIINSPKNVFRFNNLVGRIGRLNVNNPVKAKIFIYDKKCWNYVNEKDKWLKLEILAETEKIFKEEEILYLDKRNKEDKKTNFYENLKKNLKAKYSLLEKDLEEYNLNFKILNNFCTESYDFNSCKSVYDVLVIFLKLLKCNLSINFKKNIFKNLEITNSDYLPYKIYIVELLFNKSVSEIINDFNMKNNKNLYQENINIFIDKIFILINYIKFDLIKVIDYVSILKIKSSNKYFNNFISLLKKFTNYDENGLEKILEDLGIEESDYKVIKEILDISDFSITISKVISKVKEKIYYIFNDNRLSSFTKKNLSNLVLNK